MYDGTVVDQDKVRQDRARRTRLLLLAVLTLWALVTLGIYAIFGWHGALVFWVAVLSIAAIFATAAWIFFHFGT